MEEKKILDQVTDDQERGGYQDDLPGFRFHPTDEELVGFYLKRKVENKPLTIELIKQLDIYKYDPWDLPRGANVADNEGYFYCLRGRKYKNSIRPNRVTGHGFWKATGIDKPIYSAKGRSSAENSCIIGLKKSLVYYRGSAGKGTKTDWMMHEFRLPTSADVINRGNIIPKNSPEAEVWTICRILKRAVSYRKYMSDLSDPSILKLKKNSSSDASSITSTDQSVHKTRYDQCADSQIFQVPNMEQTQKNPINLDHVHSQQQPLLRNSLSSSDCSSLPINSFGDAMFHRNENWDELGVVVEYAGLDSSSLFGYSY